MLLAALALLLSLPLGIVLGLARVSPWRAIRWPVTAGVYIVRGVPLLMVIFWAYFFLPSRRTCSESFEAALGCNRDELVVADRSMGSVAHARAGADKSPDFTPTRRAGAFSGAQRRYKTS